MIGILEENENFQKLSRCYEKRTSIEKELNDFSVSDEKKEKLENQLRCIKTKISGLRMAVEDKIKVS